MIRVITNPITEFFVPLQKKGTVNTGGGFFGSKVLKRLERFYLNQGKSSFFASFGKSLIIACTISL